MSGTIPARRGASAEEADDEGRMPLIEHLRELRNRLVKSVLAIAVGAVIGFIFYDQIFDFLKAPACDIKANITPIHSGPCGVLTVSGLLNPFSLQLKVSLIAGLIIASPVWLYQLWAFVVPGLLAKEKKWALIFIAAATPMFVGGVIVAYTVLPKAITVLLSFTQAGVSNLQDINAYLSFLLRLMLVFGLGFLIPLIVLMLNIVGVIKAKQMAKYRSLVIFGTFVFGAVATPSTDPFSMLAVALPMALLFLAAEVIAHVLDRRKAQRAALAGDDLIIQRSVADDKVLRELSEGNDDGLEPQR